MNQTMHKQNEQTLSKTDIAVAVSDTHTQAETAVKALQPVGFDMKKLSIIGKDYHTEEHVVGFLNAGDRAKYFGKFGAFWGRLNTRTTLYIGCTNPAWRSTFQKMHCSP